MVPAESVQFEFLGFKPEQEMKNLLWDVAEKLESIAPSDAGVKFVMRASAGAVKASCQIVSQAGTFLADVISDSPVRAVHEIEKRIRRQLNDWKSHRRFIGISK